MFRVLPTIAVVMLFGTALANGQSGRSALDSKYGDGFSDALIAKKLMARCPRDLRVKSSLRIEYAKMQLAIKRRESDLRRAGVPPAPENSPLSERSCAEYKRYFQRVDQGSSRFIEARP